MAAVSASSSSGLATMVSTSQTSLNFDKYSPLSPLASSASITSAASSKSSLTQEDEENMTITAPRSIHRSNGNGNGAQRKSEDNEELRWLAISSLMTELTYSISDVQTRIFEIQELRHKTSTGEEDNTTRVIDESLMKLDERLESISTGMKSVSDSLESLKASSSDSGLAANMVRKHEDLLSEWESIQEDSNVLRDELKEDKWLTVFRTVTDQADGMMTSLEKAVNRCQEFIDQIRRREDIFPSSFSQPSLGSLGPEKAPPSIEMYTSLQDSFDAKKKHYMPATTKVLSIIDRGVQDRVTKNGETLRRHAESAQRWQRLKDRMARTEMEMEQCRKILLGIDSTPSEVGSVASGSSRYKSPPSSTRSKGGTSKSLTRSMSPLRKFARKITGSPSTGSLKSLDPVTPLSINKGSLRVTPASEPTRSKRTSLLKAFRPSQPTTPVTPERPSHKHSYSLTPESSPGNRGGSKSRSTTPSNLRPGRPVWNASTKVDSESRASTIKAPPHKRAPSSAGMYADLSSPHKRSLSRASMASSRPWSPVSSSVSNSQSSNAPPLPLPSFRPPSRARTPSSSHIPIPATPRSRSKTPGQIPLPLRTPSGKHGFSSEDSTSTSSQISPDRSPSGQPPRPPSRSMIPIPSLKVYSASRPSSAMSQYRGDDGSPSFRNQAARAQTPEFALRQKVQQIPFYQGSGSGSGTASPSPRGGPRPSLAQNPRSPPSSYRDSPSRLAPSRPGSRTGAHTPNGYPTHEYVPGNTKDPLDMEIAIICNSIAHGLLVERVDPPLRGVPKAGEEIMAQYAFSNSLARKVVTCRLTTLSRLSKAGGPTVSKKVMCRVGGGWQDLQMYLLNRQAGL